MAPLKTISASEFKAKCLAILDRVGDRRLERVVITKRGRPVAVLSSVEPEAAAVQGLHGFMRGSVVVQPGFDLTAPVSGEPFLADQGELHG